MALDVGIDQNVRCYQVSNFVQGVPGTRNDFCPCLVKHHSETVLWVEPILLQNMRHVLLSVMSTYIHFWSWHCLKCRLVSYAAHVCVLSFKVREGVKIPLSFSLVPPWTMEKVSGWS